MLSLFSGLFCRQRLIELYIKKISINWYFIRNTVASIEKYLSLFLLALFVSFELHIYTYTYNINAIYTKRERQVSSRMPWNFWPWAPNKDRNHPVSTFVVWSASSVYSRLSSLVVVVLYIRLAAGWEHLYKSNYRARIFRVRNKLLERPHGMTLMVVNIESWNTFTVLLVFVNGFDNVGCYTRW